MKSYRFIVIFTIIALILFGWTCGIIVGSYHESKIETSLPRCNYTMAFQMQGEHHIGYWIGENAPGEKACIIRFDEPHMVIDQGLP